MPSENPERYAVPWVRLVLACLLVGARGLWIAGLRGNGVVLSSIAWLVPVLALTAAAWLVVWVLPRGLFLVWARRGIEARAHVSRAALWVFFVAAAAVTERAVQHEVDRRMESVVNAVESFYTDRGYFPVHVEDVVPRYLRAIPDPWPLEMGCGFEYLRNGERVALRRNNLDDSSEHPCTPHHGMRYRFLLHRWETW